MIAQIMEVRHLASILELGSVSYFLDMALTEARVQSHWVEEKRSAEDFAGNPDGGSPSSH
ncbi:hypothetical protein AB4Z10_29205 [Bosea sp. RAF48]|uniref:hypothetical protein n=1 Tax=Bosea sp. RAF48 TaxID=3237480 RepID=UPI003F8EA943